MPCQNAGGASFLGMRCVMRILHGGCKQQWDIAWVSPTTAANPIPKFPKSPEMHATNHPRIGMSENGVYPQL